MFLSGWLGARLSYRIFALAAIFTPSSDDHLYSTTASSLKEGLLLIYNFLTVTPMAAYDSILSGGATMTRLAAG